MSGIFEKCSKNGPCSARLIAFVNLLASANWTSFRVRYLLRGQWQGASEPARERQNGAAVDGMNVGRPVLKADSATSPCSSDDDPALDLCIDTPGPPHIGHHLVREELAVCRADQHPPSRERRVAVVAGQKEVV